jgi:hypothetical protein
VSVLRRPVDVAERPVVCHVLGDEADFVDGVVIQAVLQKSVISSARDRNECLLSYPSLFVPNLESVYGNVYDDPLLVLARRPDGHLELLYRVLAHAVAAGFPHFEDADQLSLERLAVSDEFVLVTDGTP